MESLVLLSVYMKSDVIRETFEHLEPFLNISKQEGVYYYRIIIILKTLFLFYIAESTIPDYYVVYLISSMSNGFILYNYPEIRILAIIAQGLIFFAPNKKWALFTSMTSICMLSMNIKYYEFILDFWVLSSIIMYACQSYHRELQKACTVISIQLTLGWYICNLSDFTLLKFFLIIGFLFLAHIPLKPNRKNKYRHRLIYFYAMMFVWVVYKFKSAGFPETQALNFNSGIDELTKKWGDFESNILSDNVEETSSAEISHEQKGSVAFAAINVEKSLVDNLESLNQNMIDSCRVKKFNDKVKELQYENIKVSSIYENNMAENVIPKKLDFVQQKPQHEHEHFAYDKNSAVEDIKYYETNLSLETSLKSFNHDKMKNSVHTNKKQENENVSVKCGEATEIDDEEMECLNPIIRTIKVCAVTQSSEITVSSGKELIRDMNELKLSENVKSTSVESFDSSVDGSRNINVADMRQNILKEISDSVLNETLRLSETQEDILVAEHNRQDMKLNATDLTEGTSKREEKYVEERILQTFSSSTASESLENSEKVKNAEEINTSKVNKEQLVKENKNMESIEITQFTEEEEIKQPKHAYVSKLVDFITNTSKIENDKNKERNTHKNHLVKNEKMKNIKIIDEGKKTLNLTSEVKNKSKSSNSIKELHILELSNAQQNYLMVNQKSEGLQTRDMHLTQNDKVENNVMIESSVTEVAERNVIKSDMESEKLGKFESSNLLEQQKNDNKPIFDSVLNEPLRLSEIRGNTLVTELGRNTPDDNAQNLCNMRKEAKSVETVERKRNSAEEILQNESDMSKEAKILLDKNKMAAKVLQVDFRLENKFDIKEESKIMEKNKMSPKMMQIDFSMESESDIKEEIKIMEKRNKMAVKVINENESDMNEESKAMERKSKMARMIKVDFSDENESEIKESKIMEKNKMAEEAIKVDSNVQEKSKEITAVAEENSEQLVVSKVEVPKVKATEKILKSKSMQIINEFKKEYKTVKTVGTERNMDRELIDESEIQQIAKSDKKTQLGKDARQKLVYLDKPNILEEYEYIDEKAKLNIPIISDMFDESKLTEDVKSIDTENHMVQNNFYVPRKSISSENTRYKINAAETLEEGVYRTQKKSGDTKFSEDAAFLNKRGEKFDAFEFTEESDPNNRKTIIPGNIYRSNKNKEMYLNEMTQQNFITEENMAMVESDESITVEGNENNELYVVIRNREGKFYIL